MSKKVSIIGAGAWGTTLATLFAENGNQVTLWVYEKDLAEEMSERRENKRFLPGFQLPESITVTNDLNQIKDTEIVVFVVPTQFLRSTAKQAAKVIGAKAIIVCASKGIEEKTLKLPLDILKDELKTNNLAVLSGPNLSKEIASGQPAATVVASDNEQTARIVQQALLQERLRVYTNDDPIGVELGGALKNIIAIAAGVSDGLELGDNAKSAIMIRGIAEISRLGVALGAKAETFAGLSGMGDLITTCSSKLSRNHRVGEQLAKGQSLADIQKDLKAVAEGVFTVKAALDLGKKLKVALPITQEVHAILYQNKKPFQAISDLMSRSAKQE
ncbi:MAG: NAD(P)H-dependent glycerol-3-phosphate dehydrogenase [bacterium]